ncbi:dedicator of cytokinesis protein [Anaeramoeba ignava]|uniref:Dedicator of cytokinesis protein n=1 Tax=Anaeramoeba ignava TaxID=1746090 RepID=A0A9Q0RGG5_ANAIG|nr:dedicator of cytokinesis protein [Anaeramoeba ignava]
MNQAVRLIELEKRPNPQKNKIKKPIFDYESEKNSITVKKAKLPLLFEIPKDDIQVLRLERAHRTTKTEFTKKSETKGKFPFITTSSGIQNKIPVYMSVCYNIFYKNFIVIRRNYRNSSLLNFRIPNSLQLKLENFEIDLPKQQAFLEKENSNLKQLRSHNSPRIKKNSEDQKIVRFESQNSSEDIISLSNKSTNDLIELESDIKEKKTMNIFELYGKKQFLQDFGDSRQNIEPFPENEFYRIIVEPKQLHFNISKQFEPLFCSIALYNIANKTKVSENFYFELNPPLIRQMIPSYEKVHPTTLCKKAIFKISNPTEDIVLIIRIDKVFQGSYGKISSPYLKKKELSQQAVDKLSAKAYNSCIEYGKFRQPLAWGGFKLFSKESDSGILYSDMFNKQESLTMKPLYQIKDLISEREMLDFLQSENRLKKKEKTIPGSMFMFDIEKFRETESNLEYIINPSHEYVSENEFVIDNYGNTWIDLRKLPNQTQNKIPTREIEEFPDSVTLDTKLFYVNNLYIYPKLFPPIKFLSFGVRNILVRVRFKDNDHDLDDEGLPVFYGRSNETEFVTEQFTKILYHEKKVHFHDEIKMKLPLELNSNHHLLFSFYHVNFKKRRLSAIFEEIGHSVLVLFQENAIIRKDFALPICLNLGKFNYLSSKQLRQNLGFENDFQVQIKLVSTVYPQNLNIVNVFKYFANVSSLAVLPSYIESLQNLREMNDLSQDIVNFLPVLFNILLKFICKSSPKLNYIERCDEDINFYKELEKDEDEDIETKIKKEFGLETETKKNDEKNNENNENNENKNNNENMKIIMKIKIKLKLISISILKKMIQPQTKNKKLYNHKPKKNLNLQKKLTEKLEKQNQTHFLERYAQYIFTNMENTHIYPFQKIVKYWNIVLESFSNQNIKIRFEGEEFIKPAWFYFELIAKSMVIFLEQRSILENSQTRFSRFSHKYFKSLLRLLQNLSLQVIKYSSIDMSVADKLNKSIGLFMKDILGVMDIGRVFDLIQSYINFLTHRNINLPIKLSFSRTNINLKYITQSHFLSGSIINHVFQAFEMKKTGGVIYDAVNLIRDLLYYHYVDPRYQDPEYRSHICCLYHPFILYLIDRIELYRNYDLEIRRDLLASMIFILQSIDKKYFFSWWKFETSRRKFVFFDLLRLCLDTFEYIGKEKISRTQTVDNSLISYDILKTNNQVMEGTKKYKNAARKKIFDAHQEKTSLLSKMNHKFPDAIMENATFKEMMSQMQNKSGFSVVINPDSIIKRNANKDPAFEGNLSTQITLGVIGVLEEVFVWERSQNTNQKDELIDDPIFNNIFSVLIYLFDKNLSYSATLQLLETTNLFVDLNQKRIFTGDNNFISLLSQKLYSKVVYQNIEVRNKANFLIYFLLKKNYENTDDILRIQIHSTIAFSKLIGDPKEFRNEELISETLVSMKSYAQSEKQVKNKEKFTNLVIMHSEELKMILENGIKIRECADDSEITSELYYKIANSYHKTPELRLAWLDSLYHYNLSHNNILESFVNIVHMLALISECLLFMYPDRKWLPKGARKFNKIFASCQEEVISGEIIDIKRLKQIPSFSEEGLVKMLNQASKDANQFLFFETKTQIAKMLFKIYEHQRNYHALSEGHLELKTVFEELSEEIRNNMPKRFLSYFYRIGFYGNLFEELNGKEFIYRESGENHLFDLSVKFREKYETQFGKDMFKIIEDSKTVDPNSLDPQKAYMQITSVEPYFTKQEVSERITIFERTTNANKFFFESAFTKSGKKLGAMEDQYKRCTILTTEKTLPYPVKRVLVVNKNETELTPIQVWTDDIRKKKNLIHGLVSSSSKDHKKIEPLLVGTCLPTVNSGPIEICRVFLSNSKKFPENDVILLKKEFKQFLFNLNLLIQIHEQILRDDVRELHEQIKQGYSKLYESSKHYLI